LILLVFFAGFAALRETFRVFADESDFEDSPGFGLTKRQRAGVPRPTRFSTRTRATLQQHPVSGKCGRAPGWGRATHPENVSIGRDPSGRERYFTATKTAAANG